MKHYDVAVIGLGIVGASAAYAAAWAGARVLGLDAATPAQIDASTFRVEASGGSILMIAGADDQLWPSCRLSKIAMDRLVANGHAAKMNDDMQCYPEAGHAIGVPGVPTTGSTAVKHPISEEWLALGGTPSGIAHAARDAFERKKAFFARTLGK